MAWHWRHPENGRWQEFRLERGLDGKLLLVTRSGGVQRRGLIIRSYPVDTRAQLRRLVNTLCVRRARHGYALVEAA